VVKTTFNQRRKMLRVSLRSLLRGADAERFLAEQSLTRRPEQLSVAEFVELTNRVAELMPDGGK